MTKLTGTLVKGRSNIRVSTTALYASGNPSMGTRSEGFSSLQEARAELPALFEDYLISWNSERDPIKAVTFIITRSPEELGRADLLETVTWTVHS